MAIKTEGTHTAEFLISEASGNRSRDNAIVKSGENLPAGQVVKLSTGKLVAYAGTGTSVGILLGAVDATSADAAGVMISRDAEINSGLTTEWDAAAGTALALVGIVDRA